MAKVISGVTISLDGFAEDSKGSVGALYPAQKNKSHRSCENIVVVPCREVIN